MSKFSPSAKQFEDCAFFCAVLLVGLLACCIADGFDGVTSMKSGTYRLSDDPGRFKGVLIMRWGYAAILAAIGVAASGLGALVVKEAEKRSAVQ